jgi:hypothetical protein
LNLLHLLWIASEAVSWAATLACAVSASTPARASSGATAIDLYVSPSGSDANPGTPAAPFKSILTASRAARPGATVHVTPGTYPGGFQTTASGTSAARIRYLSEVKWDAKIVPPANSMSNTAWDNRGNYVDIDGFEIDGTNTQNGTPWADGIYVAGSNDVVENNLVHNIARNVACTSHGASAINTDHWAYGVNNDVIANIVHDIGPAGCRFDQGIYISTSGNVKNNLVYNIAEAGIHLWHDATHVIIVNNTVVHNNTGILVGGGDYYHTTEPDDYSFVANNIVYDNNYGISESGGTGTHNIYTNNLVYKNVKAEHTLRNGLTPSNPVAADPRFVRYTPAGDGDYHLAAGSPAIDAGTATNAPAMDLDGVSRPRGAGHDIGAHEFMPR